jgi:uncharacterized protein YjbJ (UPF0337 family)
VQRRADVRAAIADREQLVAAAVEQDRLVADHDPNGRVVDQLARRDRGDPPVLELLHPAGHPSDERSPVSGAGEREKPRLVHRPRKERDMATKSATDTAKGKLNQAKGKTQKAVGKATGSNKLKAKGTANQAKGKVQETKGKVKRAVS